MSKPTDGPAGPDKQQQTPPKSGGGGLIVNISTTILICSIFLPTIHQHNIDYISICFLSLLTRM